MGQLTTTLQESVLTLVCMNDKVGAVAAQLVNPDLFEPPYDDIVRRAIAFHKKYKKAPGDAHIDDLFDHILSDPKSKDKDLYKHVLKSILEQAKGLNPDYTLARLDEFSRTQNIGAAIMEAAERFSKGGEGTLADCENTLHEALKFRPQSIEKGIYLSDPRNIEYLTTFSGCDYVLGISEFDKRGIGLTKGEAFGFMAPPKKGKTWFCVHAGVMCLMQGAKVLHISLEMKDQRVMPRYLRRLFAVSKKDEKYRHYSFKFDELSRLVGFDSKLQAAKLSLKDPEIEKKIAQKMRRFGVRLNRLHFKSFPTGSLTMGQLSAYMDNLESTDGFSPDVLILDYPKLMKLDRRQELRIALGQRVEELRGLLEERKMAGVFPLQANRMGESAKTLTVENIGEDFSMAQTVDALVTYSQTRAEKALGLARLYVDRGRSEQDDFSVLIVQDYETGQFCKQSAYMPHDYFDLVKGANEDDTD